MKKFASLFVAALLITALFAASMLPAFAEGRENLASGKTVSGVNPVENDDTRKGDLTDGKYQEPGKGWYVGSGEDGADTYLFVIAGDNASEDGVMSGVIDLGSNAEVDEVKVYIGTGIVNYGIYAPDITVELSQDGSNYTVFGTYKRTSESDIWDFVTVSGEKTTARYAKITFTLNGTMALVAEIEVWGVAGEPIEDEGSEDTASEDVASEDVASEDVASEDAASEDASSEDASSEDVASEDVASENSAEEEQDSNGILLIVIASVAAVAVIAVAVILIAKKKK